MPRMGRALRDGSGLLAVACGLGALGYGVVILREHDYLSAILVLVTGLAVLRAGVELLRPTVGE